MSAGAGALFQEDVKREFIRITGQRYDSMMVRLEKKKLIQPKDYPFSKEDFREDLLAAMGNRYDGFITCRYCKSFFALDEIAADHAIPIDRGGFLGLGNLEYICPPDNNRKGKMLPEEYSDLLRFLEEKLPLARIDVLKRLEMSVKLAASIRSNAVVVNKLKENGQWQQAQAARRQETRAKENGLGKF